MKSTILSLLVVLCLFSSCSNDDDNTSPVPQVEAPASYSFLREGVTSVSYGGQTTRITMGEEFISALKDPSKTESQLSGMFANTGNNFEDNTLNSSGKSLRSKIAASADFYAANATDASAIKSTFDSWITQQANVVYTNWGEDAAPGQAGKIQEAGGGSTRYVNAKGLELNQAINKSMIGALMTDQMLNNYLSPAVLDAGTNLEDNNAGVLPEGKNYTTMEHKWDEAFGYLYGTDDQTNPQLGADSFLNKYLSRVNGDVNYEGIARDMYNAFKLGRAAISGQDYSLRDEQAAIIRDKVSQIIAIRSIYYLQQGKLSLEANIDPEQTIDYASAFHDLSEGYGFIYSLQFTREFDSSAPYFTKSEVDGFIAQLDSGDGFWDVTPSTLDAISNTIADRFGLLVSEAGN